MFFLLSNPTSGGGKGKLITSQVITALNHRNIDFENISGTSYESASANLKNVIANRSVSGIILIGGDGMVHLAIQQVAHRKIPILIIPAGTGNDFARSLNLNLKKPVLNLELLFTEPSTVDLGEVNQRYFAQVLSTGFDSMVNERANRIRSNRRWKYNLAMLLELPIFRPKEYNFLVDGKSFKSRAMLIAVANGASYGGGMKICPNAVNNDGYFDIMILRPVSKIEFLKVFPKVYRGTHINHPQIEILRGRTVEIAASAIAYADGERIGNLPLKANLIPHALKVWY